MNSSLNGMISYKMLQRLIENAWDEGDIQRLTELSRALDQHTLEAISRQMEKEMAI